MNRILRYLIIVLLICACESYATDTPIFSDTFTGTSGTDLINHTPDTGTSWAEAEDTCTGSNWEITSNKARVAVGGSDCRILETATPASTTADMAADFAFIQGPTDALGAEDALGLLIRYADTSNYYACAIFGDTSSPYATSIFKRVSGTSTTLISGTTAYVANDIIRCEAIGTSIKMYRNGAEILSTTDSGLSAAGKGGVFEGNAQTATDDVRNVWHIDDFHVYEITTAGNRGTFLIN